MYLYIQIDNHIRECEGPVQRITELKSAYEKTLHNIKLAFADAQLIPAEHYSKATLEQCITALKLELGDVLAMEEMEGGMIIIQINAEKRPKEEILNCQRKFNKGYAEICAIIYSETELLEESLRRLDAKILKSQSEIWETQKSEFEAAEMSKSQSDKAQPVDYKAVSAVIDSNRIQIAESLLWIEELNRHAVRARDKVSTALMW
ncbi:hypothetical protein EB796_005085 [Bugula neritina]|uniref:Uncharacterized protein n=1 Tax=Bugula neritina TaxID=10212 RepID=A0A7J7KGJ1_BUGNE|nr:hypothetical protein EB796_005085 [Bugula neritina]